MLNEVTTRVTEYQGVLYPHSKLAMSFDNWLGAFLIFTCCITPFEIAYLDTKVDALFVINRIVDVGFITDVSSLRYPTIPVF